ncbi:hypothetical protein LRD18_09000 [Halorhodospira halochloris]|uniref:hypothetical protein n=1 Tax=Halorhodospira halochloris TaxID=1052 RepID=UPI001EE81CBB|nr:hypothetical protein [Halorhodospira halochloris]MCG5531008.1 hypothetical protein [Halorhodospira halochloris]
MSTPGNHIWLNTAYTRSINLVRDHEAKELVRSYLPTTRALQSLQHIAAGLNKDNTENRALALIGPYGAGKSAFGLFVNALLAEPEQQIHHIAKNTLREADPHLEHHFAEALNDGRGYLRVTVNGVPDSLVRQLLRATSSAAEQAGLPSSLCGELAESAQPGTPMNDVIGLIEKTQRSWAETGGTGVLIEIDELGKFLEYDSYHPHNREIHLLQLLAEHAQQPGPAPLQVLVMLHQAFEQYSQRLDKQLREEWQKVQGRFEAIAFLEPAEQSLQVVARAFERDCALPAEINEQIGALTERINAVDALPMGLNSSRAKEIFQRCYPLHPLTVLILPILCQKAAQNERTLFSYLGSHEPHGFSERLEQLHWGDWIMPWELFDYFILNQGGAGNDPLTQQRWVEVITALERLDAKSQDPHVHLLKTIGLLNIIGAQRGLKASRELLELIFGNRVKTLIKHLEQGSYIQYRRFNHEYRVWQGSDFDLQSALEEAVVEQEQRPLAELLNKLAPLEPIIARRVTIQSGTLRRYAPRFTSAEDWPPKPTNEGDLELWLYLAQNMQDKPQIPAELNQSVVAICQSADRLRQAVAEWTALQELPKRHAELQQDPVALREHSNWLSQAEIETTRQIRSLLEEPQYLDWYFGFESGSNCKNERQILSRRDLQNELSSWMEQHYDKAPLLRNELINRDRPSPSANLGRKRLITAMLQAADKEDLGIEKTPAEKSIYLSLLKQSNLHRRDGKGNLGIFAPQPGNDPCNLLPTWNAITELLSSREGEQVPLPDLYQHLSAAPYGIKAGLLPVIITAYMFTHSRQLALYQEGVFYEALSPDQAELLCRRPELFALERFDLEGLHGELFERYMHSIVGNLPDDATLLDIIRPLVRFISNLPEYTKNSPDLSKHARAVRDSCQRARSPGALLFKDLPQACDMPFETLEGEDTAQAEEFISRIIKALRELKQAYPQLLERWQSELANALLAEQPSDLATLRRTLAERYRGLDHYTPDRMGLGAFIRRLTDPAYESDQDWLEAVATLIGRAPPSKWRAETEREAKLRLNDLAKQLRELEELYKLQTEAESENSALFKAISQRLNEKSAEMNISAKQLEQAQSEADKITKNLEKLDRKERYALIMKLMDKMTESGEHGGS